ncbi:MAG: type II toxin-antitoxin system YhaV family toxin [Gemmatimonadota bacterium]|nr:type II toxin-antitoxin system YhaV family toxin [Gemmatimonadota bacterium]
MDDRRPAKPSAKHRGSKRREPSTEPAASATLPHAHGWSLLLHPLLLGQLEQLTEAASQEGTKYPNGVPGATTKLLGHLLDLMFDKIPQRPGDTIYRGGKSLPDDWFRAKTGGGRYRLFYRFDSKTRLIVYAWVNDESNLRTYGSRTDAYAVFRDMVAGGDPPKDWAELRAAAEDKKALARVRKVAAYREKHP